jgi:hypothetical protein
MLFWGQLGREEMLVWAMQERKKGLDGREKTIEYVKNDTSRDGAGVSCLCATQTAFPPVFVANERASCPPWEGFLVNFLDFSFCQQSFPRFCLPVVGTIASDLFHRASCNLQDAKAT